MNLAKTESMLLIGGVAVAAYLVFKVASNPAKAGAALVNGAGAVVSGGVGAVGATVGLPTPDQTETDPAVARYVIDALGYWKASQWCGAGALFSASMLDANSGTPPAAGRPVWAAIQAEANGQLASRPVDGGVGPNDWGSGPVATNQPSTPAAVDKYLQGGNAPSGSGTYDSFTDPEGFGAAFGS